MNYLKYTLLIVWSLTSLAASALTIKDDMPMVDCEDTSVVLSMSKYGGINISPETKVPYLLLCENSDLIINGKLIYRLTTPVYLKTLNFVSKNIQISSSKKNTPTQKNQTNNRGNSIAIPYLNPINIQVFFHNDGQFQKCRTVLKNKYQQLTGNEYNSCDDIVKKLDWLVAWGLAGGEVNVENAIKRANKVLQAKNVYLSLAIDDLSSVIINKGNQKTLYFTKLLQKKRWDVWVPPLDKDIEIKMVIPKV